PLPGVVYVAEQGKGSWLNGRRIHVSRRDRLGDSGLGRGTPFAGQPDHPLFARAMALLTDDVAGIRRTAACAVDMAWVASGRWAAYWERALCAWDMAPGMILVREAGGMASAATGEALGLHGGQVCVSNGVIHAALLEKLNAALNGKP